MRRGDSRYFARIFDLNRQIVYDGIMIDSTHNSYDPDIPQLNSLLRWIKGFLLENQRVGIWTSEAARFIRKLDHFCSKTGAEIYIKKPSISNDINIDNIKPSELIAYYVMGLNGRYNPKHIHLEDEWNAAISQVNSVMIDEGIQIKLRGVSDSYIQTNQGIIRSRISTILTSFWDGYKEHLKLKSKAYIDWLTWLPKREALLLNTDILMKERAKITLPQDRKDYVLFADLDNFKWVNDHLSHEVGDIVIQRVWAAISQVLSSINQNQYSVNWNSVYRLWWEEMVVVLEWLTQDEANKIIKDILQAIAYLQIELGISTAEAQLLMQQRQGELAAIAKIEQFQRTLLDIVPDSDKPLVPRLFRDKWWRWLTPTVIPAPNNGSFLELTWSIGIATLNMSKSFKKTLALADKALNTAKSEWKKRAVLIDEHWTSSTIAQI